MGDGLPRIAVLGTGRMGAPVARNLLAAGFPVRVWNRTQARAEELVGAGAELAEAPALAAAEADVLLTMLADGTAVDQVATGPAGALSALGADSLWIQMSTVGVGWTARLARIALARGVSFVDAPVSGSDGPAAAGELLVLASGPEEVRHRVQPVFDAIGRQTLWLGETGNGTKLKVALNNWLATITEAAAETIALTEALGLDARVLVDTLADSPLGSPYALAKGRAMIEQDFETSFALRLALKDARLAISAARESDLELPLTEALAERWQQAVANGHAEDDVAAVIAVARRSNEARAA